MVAGGELGVIPSTSTRQATAVAVRPRTSSKTSGLRFCGMIESPWSSPGSVTKPSSLMEKRTRSAASLPRSCSRRAISKRTLRLGLTPGELDRRHRLVDLGEAQACAAWPRGRRAAAARRSPRPSRGGSCQAAPRGGEPFGVVPQLGGESAGPEGNGARHGRLQVGVAGERRLGLAGRERIQGGGDIQRPGAQGLDLVLR